MDVSHINNKLMALFEEPKSQSTGHDGVREDLEVIRDQLDVASQQLAAKPVKVTVNETMATVKQLESKQSYHHD
jgi:hypothetical protein